MEQSRQHPATRGRDCLRPGEQRGDPALRRMDEQIQVRAFSLRTREVESAKWTFTTTLFSFRRLRAAHRALFISKPRSATSACAIISWVRQAACVWLMGPAARAAFCFREMTIGPTVTHSPSNGGAQLTARSP